MELILSIFLAGFNPNEPKCVRWSWTGDVYNRKVVCLEWAKLPPTDKEPKKK